MMASNIDSRDGQIVGIFHAAEPGIDLEAFGAGYDSSEVAWQWMTVAPRSDSGRAGDTNAPLG